MMKTVVLVVCIVSTAYALPQVKSVKGGHSGGDFPYNANANLIRFWNNSVQNQGTLQNSNLYTETEKGVCYTEVPTASLVRTPGQVPPGNGSTPEFSRIRICCQGYIRNIHNFKICDPVCSKECVNSLCTAPETCTCYPDHVKNLGGLCVPTCPIGCQNGYCSGGECMCKEGYTLDRESKFCVPVCRNGCGSQGNCTAPDTCECNRGYESVPGGCRPHCDHCTDGDCVEPNVCKCHPGYDNVQGKCVPLCPRGCGSNGRCTAPNVCSCPEGYEYDQGSRQCKPKCTKSCQFGECVAPNDCRCHSGYTKSNSGECTPLCTPECGPHGSCIGPNMCGCAEGYEIDQLSRQCHPKCSTRCQNGQCVAPNECKCNNGYEKNQYGECIPDCPRGCGIQGQCIGPNTCACAPGYHLDPVSQQCQSASPAGGAGAGCSGQCLNGVCNGNICSCNPGYIPDRENPSRCIPNCPGGCVNGVCSAPNFCICDMGYVKDRSTKGHPRCVKRIRRSIDESKPLKRSNILELLVFEVPDDY